MLSYRHSFHAGNHADVLKHIVQTLIIESLKEKEKGFLYLDSHAGAGCYFLKGEHAEKTGEYLHGIAKLWQHNDLHELFTPYIQAIKSCNSGDQLKYYPGSPLIAKYLLRPQDKIHLAELHPSDYPLLCHEFSQDKRATIVKADGYLQLKSQLPPLSRRGLILIDPSYELKTDYQSVVKAIQQGYKRFSTGIYALWYPVVLRQHVKKMIHALEESHIRRILQIELAIKPDNDQLGMTASGMIVINPPWKLETQMQQLLPVLHSLLAPENTGHTLLRWITPE